MSTNEQTPLSQPTSVVRNTLRKEQVPQDLDMPAFDATLRENESGTPNRKRDLKKRLGSRHACGMSGSPEPRRGHSESPRKRDPKKTMFKRLEKVYSIGSKTGGRVHPHTRMIQGVDHTTVAAETLKCATRVLTQGKQSLLLKDIITKEYPHGGRKCCRKAKVAQEDIGSQGQRGKSRVLRMTCLSHGYTKK
uniref:Uncharacterized protein n=1 Tax=Tanacetum cinerariifolium TaxID=118510 RepID=A0A6L2J5E6_TANCI|nr:hypothetical protein [Tanacetum cinerariifolium]